MTESTPGTDPAEELARLRAEQGGAFTWAQANACGISSDVLAGRVRIGLFRRLHRGVYAGGAEPDWTAKVWAAWLAYGPAAALGGETALRWFGLDGWTDSARIELAVPHSRRLSPMDGVTLTRIRRFDECLFGSREPAILRIEVALLMVASGSARDDRAVSVLLDACRQRRTTAQRLSAQLDQMRRLPRRQVLHAALMDACTGVQSFLEQTYLTRVERAHGLPQGTRQARGQVGGAVAYRDVQYDPFDLRVELDGRAGHADDPSAWRDMCRDNESALTAGLTLRFGYQIVSDPCAAAEQVGRGLRKLGWNGMPSPCGSACTVTTGRPAA